MEAILSVQAPEAEVDLKSEVSRLAKLWNPPKPKTDAMMDHIKYHDLPFDQRAQLLLPSISASVQVPQIPTAPKPKTVVSQKLRYQNEMHAVDNLGYSVTEVEQNSYVDMAQNNMLAVFLQSLSPSSYVDMTHFQKPSSEVYSLEDNSKQKSDGSISSDNSGKQQN